jgi:hypothetical protein
VYHLEYILKPVTCAYGFVLNEISCLSQVSSKLRKDPLDVEVRCGLHSLCCQHDRHGVHSRMRVCACRWSLTTLATAFYLV